MEHSTVLRQLRWTITALLAAIVLAGCQPSKPQPSDEPDQKETTKTGTEPVGQPDAEPPGEPDPRLATEPLTEPAGQPDTEPVGEPDTEPAGQPDTEPAGQPDTEPAGQPDTEPEADVTIDLGPPLVDNPKELQRLDKAKPVWLDKKNKQVVLVGQICQTDTLLELFACLRETKEHEAIVTVDVTALSVHAGLLALGAEVGNTAKWDPQYVPASGTEIEITIVWKDEQGKRQTARAQDWIRDMKTDKAMTHPWVFAGSGFWKDESTGEEYYQAEGGDFICVSNFTTAMLDLPIKSTQVNDALMFRAFTKRIPPIGTPVTLLLTPKLKKAEPPGQAGTPDSG